MPINKAGKAYYTKEQYKKAKHECSALDYALRKGYPLIKEGKYYKMSGHDSMIFAPNGMWYWNSRGLRGKALDFIVAYEGRSVVDAVLELTEGTPLRDSPLKEYPPSMAEQISFILPPAAKNCRRLFAYLCGKRKLDRSVVSELIQRKLLYEGVSTAKVGNITTLYLFIMTLTGKQSVLISAGCTPKYRTKERCQDQINPTAGFCEGIGRCQRKCMFSKQRSTRHLSSAYRVCTAILQQRKLTDYRWKGLSLHR